MGGVRNRRREQLVKEFSVKRLIRLVLISTIGMVGIFFMSRNALLAHLRSFACCNESSLEATELSAEGYEPVLLTEWLAGDVFRVNLLPALTGAQGATGETVQAYTELHEARQDSEALTEEQNRANRHQKAKELFLERMVAGEIHLLDAANGWLEQDRTYGKAKTSIINRVYPGRTEIERYCHRVIRELELCALDHPKSYTAVLAKARVELRALEIQGSFISSN
jgi:hypothetical protein